MFGTMKDCTLERDILAFNNCFSYRNVFQNGIRILCILSGQNIIILCEEKKRKKKEKKRHFEVLMFHFRFQLSLGDEAASPSLFR